VLKRNQLHQYQTNMINKAETIPNMALFMEMGTGKTVTALTIIAEQFKGKTLVVAPKRIAESVWDTEVKNWEHLHHLKVSKVLGTEKQRLAALQEKADIYIINIENIVWLTGVIDMLVFTNLILDESQRWKDPSTKRFKAIKKHLKGFQRRLILTGTPTTQGLPDLWSQVGVLDLGERLETSLTRFRDKYMVPDQMNRHTRVVYSWKLKPGADIIINQKVSDICFSLKAEDYLQLPERTDIYHKIQIDTKTRKQYDEFRKDMVTKVKGETLTAATAATLANKLLQFTSGSIYNEEGEAREIHSAKLEFLDEMLEGSGTPTLVFYHFKHSLNRLRIQFPEAVVLDNDNLENWRNGKVRLLLAHPQSWGAGVNLQCNVGDTAQIVWWDLPWSSESYTQGNARIFRQGQKVPVIVHHLTVSNSIDELVVKALEGKISVQNILLDALKMT
jgi:SNF2 family DNA or RNA helicase